VFRNLRFIALPGLLVLTVYLAAAEVPDRIWRGEFADSPVSANPLPAAANPLRVVDWNIDRGARIDQLAAALEHERPDLCALQEVDLFARRSGTRNVAEELARRLKLNYVFAPAFEELGQEASHRSSDQPSYQHSYQGEAILSRMPLRNVRVLHFREQSGFWGPRPYLPDWSILQRRLGGRIALVAELDWHGQTLVVYDTHLESRSFGRIQSLQLNEILADARHYPEDTPIVLAGDLNTKYDAGSIGARLRQAGWRSALGDSTPRTHRLIWWCLDWILVRGPLQIDQGSVVHGVGGSDHFSISAILSIPASTRTGF